jgi:hypothetical protein
MPYALLRAAFVLSFLSTISLWSQSRLVVPDSSVGKNLQASARIAIPEPAAEQLEITIRSSDPAKLLIAGNSMEAGAESLVIRVREGFRASPEFWLQALSNEGTAAYTATTQRYGAATGTVTLTPSAIVVAGPRKAPTFRTTTGGLPARLGLYSVRLDSSLNYAEEQLLAVRPSLTVDLVSSNKPVGTFEGPVVIDTGTSSARFEFQPANEGQTTLSVKEPPGFSVPAEFATWTVVVEKPRLTLTDLAIGKDLEESGLLMVGLPAPAQGLTVTLVSENPEKLLLSASATEPGSASLTLQIKPGATSIIVFPQALTDSGTAKYTASAPGFRSGSGVISLMPSGVLITPADHGPPDEAQVLRGADITYRFFPSLAAGKKNQLAVWTVRLDPVSLRGADITVQPLRPGVSITVPLTNKEPSVGRIQPSVTITGGEMRAIAEFEPLSVGSTVISVTTPKGFTTSANSTSTIGLVRE